jgi:hypothetical protein
LRDKVDLFRTHIARGFFKNRLDELFEIGFGPAALRGALQRALSRAANQRGNTFSISLGNFGNKVWFWRHLNDLDYTDSEGTWQLLLISTLRRRARPSLQKFPLPPLA